MTGRKTGAAALAVAVVALAGCGSSSDKGLTKAEFLKQGNAICTTGNKKIEAESKRFTSRPSQTEITKFANEVVIPTIETELKDLHALKPPKSDKATVKDILDAADAGLGKAKADPALVASNNSDPKNPFADANKKANAYGLTACGG